MKTRNRHGEVSRVHSARTPDDEATRVCVASHLAELFRYHVHSPDLVDGELARSGLLTRARALALDSGFPNERVEPSLSDFVDRIIEGANTEDDLIRLSGTCPKGPDVNVRPLLLAFVSQLSVLGYSPWFLPDLRRKKRKGGQHIYGIITGPNGKHSELQRIWIGISGCLPKGVMIDTITGWSPESTKKEIGAKAFTTTGDSSCLRVNLLGNDKRDGVVGYALKPLPHGLVRDLDHDVIACGWLQAAWRAFRGSEGSMVHAPFGTPLVTQLHHGATGVTARVCPECKERALRRRQSTCGGRCRTQKYRTLKKEKGTR